MRHHWQHTTQQNSDTIIGSTSMARQHPQRFCTSQYVHFLPRSDSHAKREQKFQRGLWEKRGTWGSAEIKYNTNTCLRPYTSAVFNIGQDRFSFAFDESIAIFEKSRPVCGSFCGFAWNHYVMVATGRC